MTIIEGLVVEVPLGCRSCCDCVKCTDGGGYCSSYPTHMAAYFFIVWVNCQIYWGPAAEVMGKQVYREEIMRKVNPTKPPINMVMVIMVLRLFESHFILLFYLGRESKVILHAINKKKGGRSGIMLWG